MSRDNGINTGSPKNEVFRGVNIYVVSLGCDKNRIDTEHMLGLLANSNSAIVDTPEEADVIIVNTCGFVEDAKKESIDTILDMARYKESGLGALIVTGCLAQRYQKELAEELPEVDAFLGVSSYSKIFEAIQSSLGGKKYVCTDRLDGELTERVLTTSPHSAYLRIADGCSNKCSYCAIPMIRGGQRSRSLESVLQEVEDLKNGGVSEIIFVAQDTTKYGEDMGKRSLTDLVDKAADIMQGGWLRLLYCYPDEVTDDLIEVILKHDCVCKYMDIPIQHFSDNILKSMNRRHTLKSTRTLVKKLHDAGFTLRTSLMVGFPGETDEDFDILIDCVKELKFERLGVFKYSPEEGTKAADMSGQVSEDIKQKRYEAVMELQQEISRNICKAQIGKKKHVLIDGIDEETGMYIGRTMDQAPSVDGITYISSKKGLTPGSFHDVLIKDASEYDLLGEIDEYC